MDFRPLITVAVLNLAAAMSPGPAFLLVTRTAATASRPVAWATAAGTVAASLTWAAAALLGWQLILAQVASLYRFLQVAGGLYLCFIGWSTWRDARNPLPAPGGTTRDVRAGGFRKGLLLGLSNPKVIVFFGTIFTTLFAPSTPAAVRWLALLVILINESAWYGTISTLFGTAVMQRTYGKMKAVIERCFGALLAGFGVRLVWSGCYGEVTPR
jgi:threonine/homoserine/homoserine lactone efflux protein